MDFEKKKHKYMYAIFQHVHLAFFNFPGYFEHDVMRICHLNWKNRKQKFSNSKICKVSKILVVFIII